MFQASSEHLLFENARLRQLILQRPPPGSDDDAGYSHFSHGGLASIAAANCRGASASGTHASVGFGATGGVGAAAYGTHASGGFGPVGGGGAAGQLSREDFDKDGYSVGTGYNVYGVRRIGFNFFGQFVGTGAPHSVSAANRGLGSGSGAGAGFGMGNGGSMGNGSPRSAWPAEHPPAAGGHHGWTSGVLAGGGGAAPKVEPTRASMVHSGKPMGGASQEPETSPGAGDGMTPKVRVEGCQ